MLVLCILSLSTHPFVCSLQSFVSRIKLYMGLFTWCSENDRKPMKPMKLQTRVRKTKKVQC